MKAYRIIPMSVFVRLLALVLLMLVVARPALALEIREVQSPGGTSFWMVEEPSIPIVSLEISFRGGARLDPADRAGLARMVMGLLGEGAGELDAVAFAEARDRVAARFGFDAGQDAVTVSATMLVETLDESIALLRSALSAPRFDDVAIERIRAQMLAAIAEGETNPQKVAGRRWFARAFPEHPYGRPLGGTAETVSAITRDDLVAARARLLTRANARLAVVGAVDEAVAARLVDQVLAGLDEGAPVPAIRRESDPPAGIEVVELDVPQSVAIFGQKGLWRDDPDFIPAFVMNYILGGGGFSSRLMEEVRDKRGLAYGVYSYLSVRDEAALILGSVQTANERVAESLAIIRAEWARMAAEGVSAEELEAAQKYLTGAFPLRFDSNGKIAGYLVFMQSEGLGIDYVERRNGLIEAVTVEDIRRVAKRLLRPEALSIVVVGKPDGVESTGAEAAGTGSGG